MELTKEFVGVSSDGYRSTQYALGDNAGALTLAGDILNEIYSVYSGYSWFVQVKGGVLFIRELSFPASYGMARRLKESDFSASNLKHDVIMSAGEWLERARLRRGVAIQGEEALYVEGVPNRYQPHQQLPDDVKLVMPGETEVRESPRPQVISAN